LGSVDAALQAVVQATPHVNADETSWPTETRKGWWRFFPSHRTP
jgi:hypothetical protein